MNSFSSSPIFSPFIISSAFFKTLRVCSMPKGISLNTSFISIIIFSLNINYLHLYLIDVLVLSIHFFVRRYNQHHGTAHFILHPRNIHHLSFFTITGNGKSTIYFSIFMALTMIISGISLLK